MEAFDICDDGLHARRNVPRSKAGYMRRAQPPGSGAFGADTTAVVTWIGAEESVVYSPVTSMRCGIRASTPTR